MPDLILSPVKPCVKCGTNDRSKSRHCKACLKVYNASRNPKPLTPEQRERKNKGLEEVRRASGMQARTKMNPDEKRVRNQANTAAYRNRNKERLLEERTAKREEIREKGREYYENNKKLFMAASKRWKQRNPNMVRIARQNYRAKKRANGGVLSKDIAERLMKLQCGKCPACRSNIAEGFHLDHIISVHSGGEHSDSNIQLLCPACNMSKQAQHPIDFMQKKGYLL